VSESNDELSPGEEHLAKELQAARMAFDRFRLEWRALYTAFGQNPSDQQLYRDAEQVLFSESPEDVLPEVALEEKRRRARLFHHAGEKLSEALEIVKAEWVYSRDPNLIDEAIRKLREGEADS
jgi:hypothetical protein